MHGGTSVFNDPQSIVRPPEGLILSSQISQGRFSRNRGRTKPDIPVSLMQNINNKPNPTGGQVLDSARLSLELSAFNVPQRQLFVSNRRTGVRRSRIKINTGKNNTYRVGKQSSKVKPSTRRILRKGIPVYLGNMKRPKSRISTKVRESNNRSNKRNRTKNGNVAKAVAAIAMGSIVSSSSRIPRKPDSVTYSVFTKPRSKSASKPARKESSFTVPGTAKYPSKANGHSEPVSIVRREVSRYNAPGSENSLIRNTTKETNGPGELFEFQ